jgi:hypothetical protein
VDVEAKPAAAQRTLSINRHFRDQSLVSSLYPKCLTMNTFYAVLLLGAVGIANGKNIMDCY